MQQELSVFLNREQTGKLTFNGPDDRYGFEYSQSWLKKKGFIISPHIRPQKNDSDTIKRFLSNLLPEGKWLEELSINNQISKSNIFGLIALIGTETTGALSFQLSDDNQQTSSSSFRPIPPGELKERIKQRNRVSIATWDGKQRLSIAGMQEKLPIMIRPDGQYGFGEGKFASTHIMKFSTGSEIHMVINEFLCMKLAEKVHIECAKVSLDYYDEPVLLVERFDRQWNKDAIDRLHVIDGCQILDLPPTFKYERPFGSSGHAGSIRTGVSLTKLFNATELCQVPARARMDLLNWILFQLIIGNCDAHGKNISFFINSGGIAIAPAYDMLNIDIYGKLFNQELAMAIGEEFFIDNILPFQLAEFCEECGLQQRLVARNFAKLCDSAIRELDYLKIDILKNQDEKDFASELIMNIRTRAKHFKEVSSELPDIKF